MTKLCYLLKQFERKLSSPAHSTPKNLITKIADCYLRNSVNVRRKRTISAVHSSMFASPLIHYDGRTVAISQQLCPLLPVRYYFKHHYFLLHLSYLIFPSLWRFGVGPNKIIRSIFWYSMSGVDHKEDRMWQSTATCDFFFLSLPFPVRVGVLKSNKSFFLPY